MNKKIGMNYLGNNRATFKVWAPFAKRVDLKIIDPVDRLISLEPAKNGYFEKELTEVEPGYKYCLVLDGKKERPDPASRRQPQGVHGPSEIVDSSFNWTDLSWNSHELDKLIFYEIHIGTFTRDGTFEAAIKQLDYIYSIGVNAIELMPVGQFPGWRNWGYDGVYPFAVQNSYGHPNDFKAFINQAHEKKLAVFLDVVYNHLGPEGNYFSDFGPYFSKYYKTPWGEAINFDGFSSDEVRSFFIENALYWIEEFHIDGLRLDATHAFSDLSPKHFLEELSEKVKEKAKSLNKSIYLIAESDRNDMKLIKKNGSYNLDAQWSDDFHHSLHAFLTLERAGYYTDFGTISELKKAASYGSVFQGQYSKYWGRRHGSKTEGIESYQLIVYIQNHDQVGNRMNGERLSELVSIEKQKLAAAFLLLSPYTPLLFMGEEYGEESPFLYFVDHSNQALIESVRRGRKEEFSSFFWKGEPPDPQSELTFLKSKLNLALREKHRHKSHLEYYKTLIRFCKMLREKGATRNYKVESEADSIWIEYKMDLIEWICFFYFCSEAKIVNLPTKGRKWKVLMDSNEIQWAGQEDSRLDKIISGGSSFLLSPYSFILLESFEE